MRFTLLTSFVALLVVVLAFTLSWRARFVAGIVGSVAHAVLGVGGGYAAARFSTLTMQSTAHRDVARSFIQFAAPALVLAAVVTALAFARWRARGANDGGRAERAMYAWIGVFAADGVVLFTGVLSAFMLVRHEGR